MLTAATVAALLFGAVPTLEPLQAVDVSLHAAAAEQPGHLPLTEALHLLDAGPLGQDPSPAPYQRATSDYRLTPGVTPGLAGVFGLIGFGLGHLVVSDARWTLVFFAVDSVLFGTGALLYALAGPALVPVGAAVWLLLHLPQAADAYLKADSGHGFLNFASAQGSALVDAWTLPRSAQVFALQF